tara:strand:+ start:211 stop:567 length:357 start_codon:yes stop_codon:yes gene_type:complete
MTVKLAVVKTGEQIITDVEEMTLDDKVVGYFFNKPCIVNTGTPEKNEETGRTSFDINLSPWIALGKGYKFPVPLDWLVTFVDPVDELNRMYLVDILGEDVEDAPQSQSIIVTDGCEDC